MGLVLSVFPGIGLLDRAFEEEGFTVVRGPDLLWGGDIRTFRPPAGIFDGVIGGPPCQAFSSLAHLVRAQGFEPKFGNLIPEYERVVVAAMPRWFLMENVPQAPTPAVRGYAVHSFTVCNSAIDAGDGFGNEQERVRRFSFGHRGGATRDLREFIQLAALRLPKAGSVTSNPAPHQRNVRRQAILSDMRAVPVALGGSRKRKASVTAAHGGERKTHVSNFHGGTIARYTISEAALLQGLPADFLEDAPFTKQGKLKAIANGVPLPMGRAIASAIRQALLLVECAG